jgi:hypothetical protein
MSSAGHPVSQSLLQFAQARLLGGSPSAGRAPLSLARGRRRTS